MLYIRSMGIFDFFHRKKAPEEAQQAASAENLQPTSPAPGSPEAQQQTADLLQSSLDAVKKGQDQAVENPLADVPTSVVTETLAKDVAKITAETPVVDNAPFAPVGGQNPGIAAKPPAPVSTSTVKEPV